MECAKYVVIEGGEGVGKSTQVDLLVAHLALKNVLAHKIREPGGDPMGTAIRELILDKELDRKPETEVYLFNAARIQTLGRVAISLSNGIWAVSDRSRVSTIAYQGYGHGLELDFVRQVCDLAVRGREPDLTMLLNVPYGVAKDRREKRGVTDRFEALDDDFHERVNHGYLEEAARLGVPIINGDQLVEAVHQEIWQHVEALIERTA